MPSDAHRAYTALMATPGLGVPLPQMPAGYEFVRELGSGANGWVALALHGALARPVAIKFLSGGPEDAEGRRRLERAAAVRCRALRWLGSGHNFWLQNERSRVESDAWLRGGCGWLVPGWCVQR